MRKLFGSMALVGMLVALVCIGAYFFTKDSEPEPMASSSAAESSSKRESSSEGTSSSIIERSEISDIPAPPSSTPAVPTRADVPEIAVPIEQLIPVVMNNDATILDEMFGLPAGSVCSPCIEPWAVKNGWDVLKTATPDYFVQRDGNTAKVSFDVNDPSTGSKTKVMVNMVYINGAWAFGNTPGFFRGDVIFPTDTVTLAGVPYTDKLIPSPTEKGFILKDFACPTTLMDWSISLDYGTFPAHISTSNKRNFLKIEADTETAVKLIKATEEVANAIGKLNGTKATDEEYMKYVYSAEALPFAKSTKTAQFSLHPNDLKGALIEDSIEAIDNTTFVVTAKYEAVFGTSKCRSTTRMRMVYDNGVLKFDGIDNNREPDNLFRWLNSFTTDW